MSTIAQTLFKESNMIRYVAIYLGGDPELHERSGIELASDSASDKYEEILVNPTVLTITRQRGDIDCGGLEYVIIRYGNFFQILYPIQDGHISVAVEPEADPVAMVELVRGVVANTDMKI